MTICFTISVLNLSKLNKFNIILQKYHLKDMSENNHTGEDPQYGGYNPEQLKKKKKNLEGRIEQDISQS